MNLQDLNEKFQAAFGVQFECVIKFTGVDAEENNIIQPRVQQPRVQYETLDTAALQIERGLYVIVINERDAVYVGSFGGTLARRWLYTRDKYVYHHKAEEIAGSLNRGDKVALYLIPEQVLKPSVSDENLRPYINVVGVEAALRSTGEFPWNRTA